MASLDTLRTELAAKLLRQRPALTRAEEVYLGTQPLGYIDPEVLRYVQDRIRPLNVNLARLAVDTLAQRLVVTGFRSSIGEVVDQQLLDLWQASNMDESSQLAHTDALVHGRAFFMVWAGQDGAPRITAESATQVVVKRDPVTSTITAGLKRWRDADGYTRSLLMTGDTVVEYVSARTAPVIEPTLGNVTATAGLVIGDDDRVVSETANPLGVVPLVALVNRPRLQALDGESELSDLIPLISAIGKLGSDLMVAAEYAASPRRWATGIGDLNMTKEQSEELRERIRQWWEKAPAYRVWTSSNPEARFGTFETAELDNYAAGIELLTGQVASLACLPAYYTQGNLANPTSADAIRAAEYRLTAKARQRQAWWSGAYEELMRLAVLVRDGIADPSLTDLQTLWQDPEPVTVAQTADAQSKLYGAGIIDRRSALEAMGYTPLQVQRILEEPPAGGTPEPAIPTVTA